MFDPQKPLISRREFVGVASGVAIGAAAMTGPPSLNAADSEPRPTSAAAALERLLIGNRRFVEGSTKHPHEAEGWRKLLRHEQHPFAVILGCSDSRVPPELLFDQGFGDLFVIRVAGNVVSPDVLGSVQYAFAHLDVHLLLVLGHEGCGAVTAALDAKFHGAKEPERIEKLVQLIEPGLGDLDPKAPKSNLVQQGVVANVRWTISQMTRLPEYQRAIGLRRDARIVGAIYELASGRVELIDGPTSSPPK